MGAVLSKVPVQKTKHAIFLSDPSVHVVLEEYPFWPSTERLGTEENYIVPDYVFGVRTVWRITQPDGRPMVIIIDNTRSTGLQGRLTDAMIQVNKERQSGKIAKG